MTMRQESSSNQGAMLLSLLGGAALGAIVLALTTPRTGREVRRSLRTAVDRLRGRNEDLDDLADEIIEAMFV
jgi:gas vesicle protein